MCGKGAGGRDLGEKYDALPYNPAKAARVGLTPWSRQGESFSVLPSVLGQMCYCPFWLLVCVCERERERERWGWRSLNSTAVTFTSFRP